MTGAALWVLASLATQSAPWTSEQRLDLSGLRAGTLRVSACFQGVSPRRVVVAGPRGAKALLGPIRQTGPGCFEAALSRDLLDDSPTFWGLGIGAQPERWHFDTRSLLLQPAKDCELAGTLSVVPAPGLTLTAPWPRLPDGRYRLEHSAFARPGHAFVTTPVTRLLLRKGQAAAVECVVLPGLDAQAAGAPLRRWAEVAVDVVWRLLGPTAGWGDPTQTPLLVVVVPTHAPPQPHAESPVLHGVSSWGGARHVVVYLRSNVGSEGLPPLVGEWVLIHELIHAALPWIGADWLAEGLATYLTEVGRARSGLLTPEAFWEELVDGFLRGASVGGDLSLADESARMAERRTYWRVYWGGAAIAFLADVAIRREETSLTEQLRRLARPGMTDLQTALEAPGSPLHGLAQRWLPSRAFPEVFGVLAELGVTVVPPLRGPPTRDGLAGHHVVLVDTPAAALRRALEAGGGPAVAPASGPRRP